MSTTMLFKDFIEINPQVRLEKGREYPFIEMETVTPGHRYVTPRKSRPYKSGGSKFCSGDILFARITPCLENGKITQFFGFNGQKGFGSTEFFIFRARPGISDPAYVFYLASTDIIRGPAKKSMSGASGRQRADLTAIKNIRVSAPSLVIQRKIAAVLSAYNDLIENNLRRIKILEEMAQTLYREWFVKFRFPGHEKVQMVDSPLGKIPEGWKMKKIGNVVTLHRGKSYRSADLLDEGGLPFLNLKCIERGGGFRYNGIKRFQGEYKHTQTAKTGDIVIAVTDMTQERRLVAHAARVHVIGNDFAVISMDLVKVEPNVEVAKDYLHGLLRFSDFSQEVCQHANGVNVLHLNPIQIQEFKFALPPTELRNRYAELCASAYQECDVLHAKNVNLRRTRDLLLPKLISGEMDVEKLEFTRRI